MKKSNKKLFAFAILAIFITTNSVASKTSDPLEDFSYFSKHKFSVSVNVGLYFDDPATLTVSLENDPTQKQDGSLPYFAGSFEGSEDFLENLFNSFMFQITHGKDKATLPEVLESKEKEGSLQLSEEGKPILNTTEIYAFLIRKAYHFERFYATGHNQGRVKLSLTAHPDREPSEHWTFFSPHLDGKNVGLQVLRTLMCQAHDSHSETSRARGYL